MRVNRLKDLSFIFLMVGFFSAMYFIFAQEKEPNMIAASMSYIMISIIIFLLNIYSNSISSKVIKWINRFFFFIYSLLGLSFVLLMLYASPDDKIYSLEALIFCLGTLITIFSLILDFKNKSLE